jgi:hypothetical protein
VQAIRLQTGRAPDKLTTSVPTANWQLTTSAIHASSPNFPPSRVFAITAYATTL